MRRVILNVFRAQYNMRVKMCADLNQLLHSANAPPGSSDRAQVVQRWASISKLPAFKPLISDMHAKLDRIAASTLILSFQERVSGVTRTVVTRSGVRNVSIPPQYWYRLFDAGDGDVITLLDPPTRVKNCFRLEGTGHLVCEYPIHIGNLLLSHAMQCEHPLGKTFVMSWFDPIAPGELYRLQGQGLIPDCDMFIVFRVKMPSSPLNMADHRLVQTLWTLWGGEMALPVAVDSASPLEHCTALDGHTLESPTT